LNKLVLSNLPIEGKIEPVFFGQPGIRCQVFSASKTLIVKQVAVLRHTACLAEGTGVVGLPAPPTPRLRTGQSGGADGGMGYAE